MKSPAMRYHGGKFRLAPWVLGFFPDHRCYVEPFGGAAGVLLQKRPAYAEVYNDMDGDMVNFFRVLRDPVLSARFADVCALTPYAREEFDQSYAHTDDPVERARRTVVRAFMGFGSGGATKQSTGFRVDTRRRFQLSQHLWARYPEQIPMLARRMQAVQIENRPALEVMRQHDGDDTLHYCDPPYVLSTREERSATAGVYRHEMTDEQHAELLAGLGELQGMVIVSGYPSALYEEHLAGWERHETIARMGAGRGTGIRTEVLWLNEAASAALRRPRAQNDLLAEPN